jgi:hypothetical protein
MASFCDSWNAVYGDLIVHAQDAEDLAGLACVQHVAGDLRLDDLPSLTAIELPWLRTVGGQLTVQGDPALASLSLPRLRGVGGGIAFQYLPQLGALELPALQVGGSFLAVYQSGMTSLSFPALTSLGAEQRRAEDVLYLRINRNLETAAFPRLEWLAGVLKVSSNDALTGLTFDALAEIGGGAYISFSNVFRELTLPPRTIDGFLYLQHSHLERFSLPCLESVTADLAVNDNVDLGALHLPLLASVGGRFDVQQNPQLPQDAVDALLAQLTSLGGPSIVSGNGPPGPMPGGPPCGLR